MNEEELEKRAQENLNLISGFKIEWGKKPEKKKPKKSKVQKLIEEQNKNRKKREQMMIEDEKLILDK